MGGTDPRDGESPDPLSAVIARLLTSRPDLPVVAAYLFGSRSRGQEHRDSDVDLAVLLDWSADRTQRFELRLRLIAELIHALERNDVDLVVLNDAPPLLGRRIVVEGRRLFCRDEELERTYRRDVQLRAADLEPFLRRSRATLLSRIAP